MAGENTGKSMEVFFDTDSNEIVEMAVDQPITTAQPVSDEGDKKSAKKAIGSDELVVVDKVDDFIESPDTGDSKTKTKDDEESFEDLVDNKEKTKDKGRKTPSKGEAGSSSSSSPYSVLAKALHEEGVLADFNEDEFKQRSEELGSDVAALMELHKRTIEEGINARDETLTPLQKEYLDALKDGVPHETISTLQSFDAHVNSITPDIIDEDDSVAKDVIEQALQIRGFSDDEIKDQIETATAAGRLKTNAKNALTFLQKYSKQAKEQEVTKAAQAKEAQKQEYQDNLKAIKTKLVTLNEVVPGQKLSNKLKASMYDIMTTPVAVNQKTGQAVNAIGKKRLENPIDFDIKLAYLIKSGFFDGDMSVINRSAKSSAIKELEDVIGGGGADITSGRKPSKSGEISKPDSTDVITSLKRVMKKM